MDYDAGANVYMENFNGSHSPILGWVADGHPIYGPYAYSDPDDPASPVRRMTSGYRKRDGGNSSTNLNVTGRTTLPQWASRLQGRSTSLASNRYGPNVSTTYILGHYLEDYAYMGDLGLSHGNDFDLDEYNGRFCLTPEFPDGVWAYFTTIEADGTPLFPYNVGRNFYGTPTGGNANTIPSTATRSFIGGPSKQHSARDTDSRDGVITLTWNTVEGASYQVEQGPDLQNWTEGSEEFTAAAVTQTTSDTPSLATEKTQFYRLKRTGIANYDDSGFDNQFEGGGGNNGGGVVGDGADNFVATFTGPPLPPENVIQQLRIGDPGIPASLVSMDSRTQLTVSFDATALPAGNHAVYVIFTPPGRPQLTLISTNRFSQ